ncbi:MAG TPA: TfpX/TfpZ family type IV pilin accessory protein [Burkholderiales bacterium]
MTRWKASGLHLAISAFIAASGLVLMLAVWYPDPLFEAAGGAGLLVLLTGVDVVVGPLITLIIFRSGKRGLKFDLCVIGAVQLAALLYGMHVVYLARPVYMVFIKDRFDVATAVSLQESDVAKARLPEFRSLPLGRPRFVAAVMPQDPAERSRVTERLFGGQDLYQLPEYYVPYDTQAKQVLSRAATLERLRDTEPKAAAVAEAYLARSGTQPEAVRFVDMRAPRAWVTVVVDAKTAQPVKMLLYDSF